MIIKFNTTNTASELKKTKPPPMIRYINVAITAINNEIEYLLRIFSNFCCFASLFILQIYKIFFENQNKKSRICLM